MILLTTSKAESFCAIFSKKGLKLSLAESCTGGMIGCMITSVSGSSSFFMGSAVTYSNESKMSILGVKESSLAQYGAVSETVAKEMAEGSLKVYGSDIAGSVTGIAGPDGGTPEKPVGTVWMAVTDGRTTRTYENHFTGSRKEIREMTASVLLDHIEEFIGSC